MCGIAGYIGGEEIGRERLDRCLGLMRRRGPDHAAMFHHSRAGRNAYRLHSRLGIIDLDERGNQPFRMGPRALVYNGELYNYTELKRELAARGRRFATESDTEVLLACLAEFGWRGLDKGEGMWAFGLYNSDDGSLLLGRDRFGEKPLFLYRERGGLYFASEVKCIAALLGRRLEIDFDHLYRYLGNGYKSLYKACPQPGPGNGYAFFQGLEELAPGTVLCLDALGREERRRYWEPEIRRDDSMSYADAVAGAHERLIESVKLRLRADVPLAFCMSGGVDSNALISIAKNIFGYDVHGFTIANSDARYEEQELVEHAVAELGIRHTTIPVDTGGILAKLRELVRYHDAPVYTITYFAHWLLMEAIAERGYRISVSGTGADELFTGYFDHHLAYLYEVHGDADLYPAARRAWMEKIRPIVRNPYLSDPDAFIANPALRDHIFLNADGFGRYLKTDWSEPFTETRYTDSLLRNRMLNEIFHEAGPVILPEDDWNAMYFSIENRSPFLDRRLFEFCHRIPTRHLIRDGYAKAVLRDAVRGIAPEKIIANPRKVGFNAPIFSFLDVGDPEVRSALLDRSPSSDHVRREMLERLIAKPDLPNSESKFLFYFLTGKMFLEEFQA